MSGRIYTYVITHDVGFAPNPFHGWCTLACCKPAIRRSAQPGDWLVGLTPRRLGNRVVYAMRVDESLLIADYWADPRFRAKRPDWSTDVCVGQVGDNCYEPLGDQRFRQHPCRHYDHARGREHSTAKARDLGGRRVLVSQHFAYFGSKTIPFPDELEFARPARAHRCRFSDSERLLLQRFVESLPLGVHAAPQRFVDAGARVVERGSTAQPPRRRSRRRGCVPRETSVLPRRLILSRKGFDSGSGGGPSPILPDGSVLSLPIPDRTSSVSYDEIRWRGRSIGPLVEQLSRGRVKAWHGAHLDPDLREDAIERSSGWRPTLGQEGGAQGHLRNQGVEAGDLFLFWGLFRRVDESMRWTGPLEHRIWGWLRIGEIAPVDAVVRADPERWAWAARHPHLTRDPHPSNTLYVAADHLDQPGLELSGSGLFEADDPALRLTARDASRPSLWELPRAFEPRGRSPLSYHANPDRWTRRGDRIELQSVARGQEFVLDLDEYPGVADWVRGLLASR